MGFSLDCCLPYRFRFCDDADVTDNLPVLGSLGHSILCFEVLRRGRMGRAYAKLDVHAQSHETRSAARYPRP